MASRRTSLLATAALLATTAAWGSTFFLIKDLLDRVPVLDFLAVRFAIASVALLLLSPRAVGRLSRERRRQALVLGGLYGVAIGRLFAAESMFHRRTDASKAALVALSERLGDDALVDVQWLTPHLASLGAVEIPRAEYLRRLERALA